MLFDSIYIFSERILSNVAFSVRTSYACKMEIVINFVKMVNLKYAELKTFVCQPLQVKLSASRLSKLSFKRSFLYFMSFC